MLLKILLLIGVIAAVYFLFFKKSTPVTSQKQDGGTKKSDDDTMVPCASCGVFVSVNEAFIKDGKYFCSEACMEQQ